MRIVKNPDERKQDIIDGAIRLFATKGYEKTSITDIAKYLGISQGLCYRYFTSKEEIYDVAIEEYANLIVSQNIKKHRNEKTMEELIYSITDSIDNFTEVEKENKELFELFHSPQNKRLHDDLFIRIVERLIPHVTDILEKAKEKGEINIDDPKSIATFSLYGQMGVFHMKGITDEERMEMIRSSMFQLLGLKRTDIDRKI